MEYLIPISLCILAGFIDGMVEGFVFTERTAFERKWKVSPLSFFGSQSWKTIYKDNDPELGYKSKFIAMVGAIDFYHVGDDLRKALYLWSGAMLVVYPFFGSSSFWGILAMLAIGYLISGAAKSLALKYISK